MVKAAALDGVVQLTGAVAGQNGDRRELRLHRANLGDADLVLPQVLQQKGLKRLISAVYLVDQQHGTGCRCLQGLQQRAADEVAVLVDLALHVSLRFFTT